MPEHRIHWEFNNNRQVTFVHLLGRLWCLYKIACGQGYQNKLLCSPQTLFVVQFSRKRLVYTCPFLVLFISLILEYFTDKLRQPVAYCLF